MTAQDRSAAPTHWRPSPDVKQLDALARRFPSVGRLRRAAQDLNGAMVAYHREHPIPDEFLQEHLALTALLAPPKEAR